MADAIVNPEELKQFASHLSKVSSEFRQLRETTRSKMSHLNQSWRDGENAKFVQQFEQDIKPLEKLIQTAEEYSSFLKRKAASIEPYFNTRL